MSKHVNYIYNNYIINIINICIMGECALKKKPGCTQVTAIQGAIQGLNTSTSKNIPPSLTNIPPSLKNSASAASRTETLDREHKF